MIYALIPIGIAVTLTLLSVALLAMDSIAELVDDDVHQTYRPEEDE